VTKEYEEDIKNKAKQIYADDEVSIKLEQINKQLDELLLEMDEKLNFITNKIDGPNGVDAYVEGAHTQIDRVNIDQENMVDEGVRNTTSHPSINAFKNNRTETKFLSQDFINESILLTDKNNEVFINGSGQLKDSDTLHTFTFNLVDDEYLKIIEFAITYKQIPNIVHKNEDNTVDRESTVAISRVLSGRFFVIRTDPVNNPTQCIVKAIVENSDNTGNIIDRKIVDVKSSSEENTTVILDDGPQFDMYFKVLNNTKLDVYIGKILPYRYVIRKTYLNSSTGESDSKIKTCTIITGNDPAKPKSFNIDELHYSVNLNTAFCVDKTNKKLGYFYFTETITESDKKLLAPDSSISYDGSEILDFWAKDYGRYTLIRLKTTTIDTTYITSRSIDAAINLNRPFDGAFILSTEELILRYQRYFYYFDTNTNGVSTDTFFVVSNADTVDTFERTGTIVEINNKYALVFYTTSDSICYRVKTIGPNGSYRENTSISPEKMLTGFPIARVQNLSATKSTIENVSTTEGIYVYAKYSGTSNAESIVYCLSGFTVDNNTYNFKHVYMPKFYNIKTKTSQEYTTPSPIRTIKNTNIFNFAITEDGKLYIIDEERIVNAVTFEEVSGSGWTDKNSVLRLKREKNESEYFDKNNAYLQDVITVGNGLDGIHIIDKKGIYKLSPTKELESLYYVSESNSEIFNSIKGPYNVEYALVHINETIKKYFYVRTVPYYSKVHNEKLKTKYIDLFSNEYQLFDEPDTQYKANLPIIEFKALLYVSFVDHLSPLYNTAKTTYITYNKVMDLATVTGNGNHVSYTLTTNKYGFIRNELMEITDQNSKTNISDINSVKRNTIIKRPNDGVTYDSALESIHNMVKQHYEKSVKPDMESSVDKKVVYNNVPDRMSCRIEDATTTSDTDMPYTTLINAIDTKIGKFIRVDSTNVYKHEFNENMIINTDLTPALEFNGNVQPELAIIKDSRYTTFIYNTDGVYKDHILDENGDFYTVNEGGINKIPIISSTRYQKVTAPEEMKGIGCCDQYSDPLFFGVDDAEKKYSKGYIYNSNTDEFTTTDPLSKVGLILASNSIMNKNGEVEHHIIAGETISPDIPPAADTDRPLVYKVISKDRDETIALNIPMSTLMVINDINVKMAKIAFYNFENVKILIINGIFFRYNSDKMIYEYSTFTSYMSFTAEKISLSEFGDKIFIISSSAIFEYDFKNDNIYILGEKATRADTSFGKGYTKYLQTHKIVEPESTNNHNETSLSPVIFMGSSRIYPIGEYVDRAKFVSVKNKFTKIVSPAIWNTLKIDDVDYMTYSRYYLACMSDDDNKWIFSHSPDYNVEDDSVGSDGKTLSTSIDIYNITSDDEPGTVVGGSGDEDKTYYIFDLSKASFSKLHTMADFNKTTDIIKTNKIYRVEKINDGKYVEVDKVHVKSPIPGFEYYKQDLTGMQVLQRNLKQFDNSTYFCPVYEVTLIDTDTVTYADATKPSDVVEKTFVGLYVLCEPSYRETTADDFDIVLSDDGASEKKTFKSGITYYEKESVQIESVITDGMFSSCGEYLRYQFKDKTTSRTSLNVICDTTSLIEWNNNRLRSSNNDDVLNSKRTIYPIIRYWKTSVATFALFVSNVGTKFTTIFCRCSDDFKTIYEEYVVATYGDSLDAIANLKLEDYDRYEVTETSKGVFIVNTNKSGAEISTYIYNPNTLTLTTLNTGNDVPYRNINEFEDGNIYAFKKTDDKLRIYKFDTDVGYFGVDPEFEVEDTGTIQSVLRRVNPKTGLSELYVFVGGGKWGLYILHDNKFTRSDNIVLGSGISTYKPVLIEGKYIFGTIETGKSILYSIESGKFIPSGAIVEYTSLDNSGYIKSTDVNVPNYINNIIPNFHQTELVEFKNGEPTNIIRLVENETTLMKYNDTFKEADSIVEPTFGIAYAIPNQNSMPVVDNKGELYFSYAKADPITLKPDMSNTYHIIESDGSITERVNFEKLFYSSMGLIGFLGRKVYISDVNGGSPLEFTEVKSSDGIIVDTFIQTFENLYKLYERDGKVFIKLYLMDTISFMVIERDASDNIVYTICNPGWSHDVGHTVHDLVTENGSLNNNSLIYMAKVTDTGLEVVSLSNTKVWVTQDEVDTITDDIIDIRDTIYGIIVFTGKADARVRNISIKEWQTFNGLDSTNKIYTICDNPKTKTVYIGTDKGTYEKNPTSDNFTKISADLIRGIFNVTGKTGETSPIVVSTNPIMRVSTISGFKSGTYLREFSEDTSPDIGMTFSVYRGDNSINYTNIVLTNTGMLFCIRDDAIPSVIDAHEVFDTDVIPDDQITEFVIFNNILLCTIQASPHIKISCVSRYNALERSIIDIPADKNVYAGYSFTFIGKTNDMFNNESTDVSQTLRDKYSIKCVGLYSPETGFVEKYYDNNSYIDTQSPINDNVSLEEFYKLFYFDNTSKNKNNTMYPRKNGIRTNNFVTPSIPIKDTGIFDNGYFNIELTVFPGGFKESSMTDKVDVLKTWNGSFFKKHDPILPFYPY
jgi:hypothetical protein